MGHNIKIVEERDWKEFAKWNINLRAIHFHSDERAVYTIYKNVGNNFAIRLRKFPQAPFAAVPMFERIYQDVIAIEIYEWIKKSDWNQESITARSIMDLSAKHYLKANNVIWKRTEKLPNGKRITL
jgi:hypothetical protein